MKEGMYFLAEMRAMGTWVPAQIMGRQPAEQALDGGRAGDLGDPQPCSREADHEIEVLVIGGPRPAVPSATKLCAGE